MPRNMNSMSGTDNSGRVLMKACSPPGTTVPGPVPKKYARNMFTAMRSKRISRWKVPGPLREYAYKTEMILQIAPDRQVGDDLDAVVAADVPAGPMPDSIRSCGELNAPPARITSLAASTCTVWPPCRYSTPVARVP